MIPARYGHLADHRQSHPLPSYFVRTVFPFATKEQKFASREKSPKCLPGGGAQGRGSRVGTRIPTQGSLFPRDESLSSSLGKKSVASSDMSCRWQRQFWDTNQLMYQCIVFQFLRKMIYLYEYVLNSYFQSLAALVLGYKSINVSMYW